MTALLKKYRLPVSFLLAFLAVWSISSLISPETDCVVMTNSF